MSAHDAEVFLIIGPLQRARLASLLAPSVTVHRFMHASISPVARSPPLSLARRLAASVPCRSSWWCCGGASGGESLDGVWGLLEGAPAKVRPSKSAGISAHWTMPGLISSPLDFVHVPSALLGQLRLWPRLCLLPLAPVDSYTPSRLHSLEEALLTSIASSSFL
jgi:hypothetical protein